MAHVLQEGVLDYFRLVGLGRFLFHLFLCVHQLAHVAAEGKIVVQCSVLVVDGYGVERHILVYSACFLEDGFEHQADGFSLQGVHLLKYLDDPHPVGTVNHPQAAQLAEHQLGLVHVRGDDDFLLFGVIVGHVDVTLFQHIVDVVHIGLDMPGGLADELGLVAFLLDGAHHLGDVVAYTVETVELSVLVVDGDDDRLIVEHAPPVDEAEFVLGMELIKVDDGRRVDYPLLAEVDVAERRDVIEVDACFQQPLPIRDTQGLYGPVVGVEQIAVFVEIGGIGHRGIEDGGESQQLVAGIGTLLVFGGHLTLCAEQYRWMAVLGSEDGDAELEIAGGAVLLAGHHECFIADLSCLDTLDGMVDTLQVLVDVEYVQSQTVVDDLALLFPLRGDDGKAAGFYVIRPNCEVARFHVECQTFALLFKILLDSERLQPIEHVEDDGNTQQTSQHQGYIPHPLGNARLFVFGIEPFVFQCLHLVVDDHQGVYAVYLGQQRRVVRHEAVFAVLHGDGGECEVVELVVVFQPFQRERVPEHLSAVAGIHVDYRFLHVIVGDGLVSHSFPNQIVVAEAVVVDDDRFLAQVLLFLHGGGMALGREDAVGEEAYHAVAVVGIAVVIVGVHTQYQV